MKNLSRKIACIVLSLAIAVVYSAPGGILAWASDPGEGSTTSQETVEQPTSGGEAASPDSEGSTEQASAAADAKSESASKASLAVTQKATRTVNKSSKARRSFSQRAISANSGASLSVKWSQGTNATITDDGKTISLEAPEASANTTVAAKGKLTFHCDQGTSYEPGSIQFYLPLYLFKQRDGSDAGQPVNLGVPKDPSTNDQSAFNYLIDEENDRVIIKNHTTIDSTLDFTCDFEYDVDYDNVYDIENGAWFSTPVTGTIQGQALDAGTIKAQIITSAEPTSASKSKTDRFVKWQSEWGTQPEGITDGNYVYYVFKVDGTRSCQGMPYQYRYVDSPSDNGIPVAWKGSSYFDEDSDGNNVEDTWQSISDGNATAWSSEKRPTDRSDKNATASIVVAYPKSAEADGREMTNKITFQLKGKDNAQPEEVSATITFKNDTVQFTYEGDSFSVNKHGISTLTSIQGALRLLSQGKDSQSIPFVCTAPDHYDYADQMLLGYNLTKGSDGEYGEKTWTAELIDDQVYLEGKLLEPGDYEIVGFDYIAGAHVRLIDDPDRESYRLETIHYDDENGSDENNTLSLYYRTTTDGEWQLYKTFSANEGIGAIDWSDLHAIQMKLVATTNDYGLRISATPYIKLKPSEHVLSLISGKTDATLTNVDALRVTNSEGQVVNPTDLSTIDGSLKQQVMDHDQAGNYGLVTGQYLQHDESSYPLNGGAASLSLEKKGKVSSQSATTRTSTVRYTLTEQMRWGSGGYVEVDDYEALMGGYEKEATFYDLLPEGMSYVEGSCQGYVTGKIYSSQSIYSTPDVSFYSDAITVEQHHNWQGSGRTLVVFHVNVPDNECVQRDVVLYFNATYPFDASYDLDISPDNDAAVASDVDFDNCYADSPTAPRGTSTASTNSVWNAYFNDLDGDSDSGTATAQSTAYANRQVTVSPLDSAQSGYSKAVKAEDDDVFGQSAETYANGAYSYQLRYRPAENASAKGLVFYDTLENAQGEDACWEGTLQSVDVSRIEKLGADVKVYYSTAAECDPNNDESDRDLTDTTKWSTATPSDMSAVTAIAIDLSKGTSGDDFILGDTHTALAYVNMKAPSDVAQYVKPTKVYAYNNSAVNVELKNEDESTFSDPAVTVTTRTKVSLRIVYKNLTLSKTVTGTSADKARDYTYDLTFSGLEPSTTYTFYDGTDTSGTASGYTFTSDADGKATARVKLKDAESLTVALPQNAKYTVSEQGTGEMAPSYTITCGDQTSQGSSDTTGADLSTGEQALSDDSTVAYTNENKATVDVPVKKTWSDSSFSGTRPPVTIKLLANGLDTGKSVTLDGTADDVETTAWNATFEGLDKYDGDWKEIEYTVQETTDLGAGWSKQVNAPAGDGAAWEVVNTYTPTPVTAEIPVEKVLAKGDDSYNAPDVTGKFTFTISDDPSDNVTSPLPDDNTVKCGASGTTVKFGSISYDKPGTYKYLVKESGSLPGVTNDSAASTGKAVTVTIADNAQGALYVAGISSTEASPFTFTNTYTPDPVEATVPVKKVLSYSSSLTPNDITGKFTFAIADDTSDQVDSPLPSPATVSCGKDGDTVSFGKIKFTKPGTYKYVVTESGSADGVTNDSKASTGKAVTVVVSDDGSGELKVDSVSSTSASPLTFTNAYTVSPTAVAIPTTKVISKTDDSFTAPDATGKFEFTIADDTSDDVSSPLPTNRTVACGASGTAVNFGAITYTEPGTYKYKVTESGSLNGVVNDAAASSGKTVTVSVKDNGDGTMTATVSGADATADQASGQTTFTNAYTPGKATATIPVTKRLAYDDGLAPADITGKFEFTIADDPSDDVDSPLPDANARTVENTGSGSDHDGGTASFGTITYDRPGTYRYTITETSTVEGVANDATAAKTVTVTVTDDGTGQLSAAVRGADASAGAATDATTFTNTYTVEPTTATVPVKKIVAHDSDLTPNDIAGKFTFTIADDTSDQVDSPLPENKTVECDSDGKSVDFDSIEFTKPGTYKYLVTESGEAGGIANDAAAKTGKHVTITVKDNSDGTMTATVSGADATDTEASATTTFTNTYTVSPISATIPAKKVLEKGDPSYNAPDITGKFTFTLAAVGDAPMPATGEETFTNTASGAETDGGTASFGQITYTKPGEYKYTVTESGTVPGITNDEAAESGKAVTVTIKDNGFGALYVDSVSSTADDPLTFTNTYTPAPVKVAIPVTKVLAKSDQNLSGPGSIAGKFTFSIADDPADEVESPLPSNTSVSCAETGETVTFDKIAYDRPGTYRYLVTEAGTVPGISNDAAAATGKSVTVTVTDDGTGALAATVSGADGSEQQPDATTFTNTYTAEPATAIIPVKKVLESKAASSVPDITGKFTFTLTEHDSAPMPEGNGAAVTNPDRHGGTARFGQIEFTTPGTYRYTITESGKVDNVTNDAKAESGKAVTVTVTDDGAGQLHATVSGADATEDSPTELTTFTNVYNPDSGNADISKTAGSNADGTSATAEKEGDTDSPDTGDDSTAPLLAGGALAAAICGGIALVLSRRRRQTR